MPLGRVAGQTTEVLNMKQPKQFKHSVGTEAARQDAKALFDENAAAAYLDLRPGTLAVWRSTKRYALPYIKCGARVRYRKRDLDAFLEARTVEPA
jgi:hypothetical protein